MGLHTCDGCGLEFRNLKAHQKHCADAQDLIGGNLLKRRIEEADYALELRAEKRLKKQEKQRETREAQERAIREAAARDEAERARNEVSGINTSSYSMY